MDGSLLVSQSRSLSCSYVPSMSIQQDRNSMVCCCAACTLGIKHIEISICADLMMQHLMMAKGASVCKGNMEQQIREPACQP